MPAGPYTVRCEPGTKAGRKNGSPWMWSAWVWLMNRCARVGPPRASAIPSFRAPVPQSKIRSVPSSARASTQGVFPP